MVSVLVLAYQHVRFISGCLDAILDQRFDMPYEVLVGEDESSDGTRAICERYAAEHPDRIRLFLRSRKDVVSIMGKPSGRANLIALLGASRGRYIAICDGDDRWTDGNKLDRQVRFLEKHPDTVLTFHDARVVDAEGRAIKGSKIPDALKKDLTARDLRRAGSSIPMVSMVMRNLPVLHDLPHEFRQVLNGDNFLTMLLGEYGSAHYMPEITPAVYHVHGGGIWSSRGKTERKRAQVNTWMWMAAYQNRMGDVELAEHFIGRANDAVKRLADRHALKYDPLYRSASRALGVFGKKWPR